MKRLLLASSGLGYLKEFVGKDPSEVKMLFIPTAANLDKPAWWVDKDRDVLKKMGFDYVEFDVEGANPQSIDNALKDTDIVYVAGGNTFYLLKQVKETGFDKALIDFVNNGGLYAGASAGAILPGPSLEPIRNDDDADKVQGLASTDALNLVDVVIRPHQSSVPDNPEVDFEDYQQRHFKTVYITDDQAVLVEGDEWKIVDSPRSELEIEWFNKSH